MSAIVDFCKLEYLEARKETKDAWANFCLRRAECWPYKTFRIIAASYRAKVVGGRYPKGKFLEDFNRMQKTLVDFASKLPEFDHYMECKDVEKSYFTLYEQAVIEDVRKSGGV